MSDTVLPRPFAGMASIFLMLLAVRVSASSSCDVTPLHLPIQDVQVMSNISDSVMKGIPASVGTPAQDIVMLPWPELNGTWIYDQDAFCDPSVIFDGTICQVRRGNFFLETDSTSFQKASDVVAAGAASEADLGPGAEDGIKLLTSTGLGGTDWFLIGDNGTALDTYPIGIPRLSWDAGYTYLHSLGLGRDSTYLNALVKSGRIASRVWSIFWGRMWVSDSPLNGSLVVGGYDEEKVIGPNYTQPLDYDPDTGCWTGMKVQVVDIQLNFGDGSDVSLLNANSALPACIVPQRQLLLEAPTSILDNFENATGMRTTGPSFGIHWSAQLYDTSGPIFDGDMTFTLSSGLQIRVPNSQYLVPFVTIDRNGSRIFNDSQREFLMNPVSNQPATLGRYFFTAAYLMVDHDASTFSLGQANPTNSSSLVSILSAETAANCSGLSSNSSVIVPPLSTGTSNEGPSSPSVGLVVGVVIASVVGLAGIAPTAWIYFRRRRSIKTRAVHRNQATGLLQKAEDLPRATLDRPLELCEKSPILVNEVEGQMPAVYELDEGQAVRRGGV